MKVYIDAFGGDHSPSAIIDGALMAVGKYDDIEIVLFGKQNEISDYLSNKIYNKERIFIVDAPEIIINNEAPVNAIRTKKNSSIVKAFEMMKDDADCIGFISAGSTGAVLTGAFLKLGRLPNINRPALAPLFPTIDGKQVLIIDCGANMDSDEHNLQQFAIMGNAFMKNVMKVDNPRVALLNVGNEDEKGNEMVKKAFQLLKSTDINFVGNMEARYALSGDYDVIVTDGFAGNVLIKSIEGTGNLFNKMLKGALTKNLKTKLGTLLIKRSLKEVLSVMNYHKYGGAPLLGTKNIVIKAHGSSNAESICTCVKQVEDFYKADLLNSIKKALEKNED